MAAAAGASHGEELKARMRGRIRQVMREATGPSFDDRVKEAAKAFRQQASATETEQAKKLEEAKERAKARPSGSAFRPKDLVPPTPEERGLEHAKVIRENTTRYAKEKAEREHRMQTREPLFRVSAVKAAQEEQKKRQAQHRQDLKDEEAMRWKHIEELKEKASQRPMLVEDFSRPVHSRSVPNIRLIPEYTQDTPLQKKIKNGIEQQWFTESAWGKEVQSIQKRQDSRPRLHEIAYPPKKIKERKLAPRELYPIEVKMHEVTSQRWFQKSQWAEQVREIVERQNDRPKLHEISYPPRR